MHGHRGRIWLARLHRFSAASTRGTSATGATLIITLLAALAPWMARAAEMPAELVKIEASGETSIPLQPGAQVWVSNTGDTLPIAGAAADPERVLIRLRGAPLARAAGGSTAVALAAQRQRAASAIAQAVALSGQRSVGQIIRREYAVAFHGFAATIPAAARARVLALPDVEAIYPDVRLRVTLNDSVPLIGAPDVWASSGSRGAGQRIAVIDTGVDYAHADLGGCLGTGCKVVDGYDFVNGDSDPLDDNGHGTHVAATAAGSGTFDGVAPDASILAYKVCDAVGDCDTSDIIAGIERAVDPDGDLDPSDHADIINLSLAGPGDADDATSQAVDNATAAGAFVAAAAGNGALYFGIGTPGAARTALTVGATTKTDVLASFSSKGPSAPDYDLKPEIVAPGVSICAAKAVGTGLGPDCTDATHISINGTSMATPHVAGAAALLKSITPTLTPAELKSLLVQSSVPLPGGALRVGAGRLNVEAAAAARTVIEPAAVSFGLDDLSQTIWTPTVNLTVTNLDPASRSFSLSVSGIFLGGITLTPVPSSFTLGPGQSQAVSLGLSVDNTLVPSPLTTPFAYDGIVLSVTAGAEVSRVPVAFLKTPRLRLLFDVVPTHVIAHNRGSFETSVTPMSTIVDLLVQEGTYDVIATFSNGTIVHEGIVVVDFTQHTMLSTEPVYTLSFDPRDESNVSLPVHAQGFTLAHRPSRNGFTVLGPGPFSVNLGSVSTNYDVGFGSLTRSGSDRYLILDGRTGLSAAEVFGNVPADLLTNLVRYHARPGELVAQLSTQFQFVTAGLSFAFVSSEPWAGTDLQLHVTPAPFEQMPFFLQQWAADSMSQVLHASGLMQGGVGVGDAVVFNFGDASTPTYATSSGELPLNLGPPYFSRRFNNQSGQVFWLQPWRNLCLSFHTQGGDGPEAAPIPWELKAGNAVVQTGTAAQSTLSCALTPPSFPPLLLPNADYRFDVGDLDYFVAGQAGSTRASAWFDNGAPDPNPPAIAGLALRANGQLTDVTDPSTPVVVTLTLIDTALDEVTISYDDGAGYIDLPVVEVAPGIYEATIAGCQPGGVSLEVAATDASDNRLQQEFNPAYLCRPAACGNGFTEPGEACDDANTVSGDGCNATCTSLETCGNGVADFGSEDCDDGGVANGDGCSSTCTIEPGWACSGVPSSCVPECGDGAILTPEACDDANLTVGDGCDASCTIEAGWTCAGQPSSCAATCGDGLVVGPEGCDDGATANGDGCSSVCATEAGWICSGEPSVCSPVCGDGVMNGNEDCDDGNQVGGDCCPANCQLLQACHSPGKSILIVKHPVNPTKKKVVWKWLRGTSPPPDAGDPTASTGYRLCLWDDGRFVYDAGVAPGIEWNALGAPGSFKYVNPATSADGTALMLLKSGSGKAKIVWKGKGANVALPGPQASPAYFAQSANVMVRVMRDDGAPCWESVYTTSRRNVFFGFKALTP